MLRVLVAGACAGLSSATLAANEANTQKMEAVTVSASRADTKLEDMPLSTTVLTREDIEKSPATSVDQLLKNVPGVNLSDTPSYVQHPTGQSISMRGLGNARTLVLMDGIPLNDAFYGTVQWHKVPMSSIERIEVIKGAASSLWGNMAMGGVINIITRVPKEHETKIAASYGSFNTSKVAADKGFSASDTVKVRLFADNFLTSGYVTVPESQRLSGAYAANVNNGSYARNSNIGATVYFQPDAVTSGHFRLGYHEMHEEGNGNEVAPNNQRSADAALGLTSKLSDGGQVQANAWYQNTDFNTMSGAYTPATYKQTYYDNPYDDFGASLVWSKALKDTSSDIQAGADYRRISGSNASTNYQNAAGVIRSTNFGDGTHQFIGVFGQWKWAAADVPLDLTMSARYDYWKNDGKTSNQPYVAGAPSGSPVEANFDTSKGNFNPSLALHYFVNDSVKLRAAAYKAFHAPGLNNMYRTYGGSSVTFSNPNLMPETMVGYEAGLDFQAQDVTAKFTLFDNLVKDLVTTYTLASGSALETSLCGGVPGAATSVCPAGSGGKNKYYKNAGEAQMRGVEMEVQFRISPTFAVNGNFVYTDAVLTQSTTTDPTGLQLQTIPKRTGLVGATWDMSSQWRLYGEVRAVSEFWADNAHQYHSPGYATVNANLTYKATKETEFFGSVINLFDRTYVASGGFPPQTLGMPLAVYAGVRTRF
jgi:iron complex outermembrane receptor protein